jgi:hypothetical protein
MSEMNFDKFVEDLEKRQKEAQQKKKSQSESEKNWPARKIAEKYRENPGNRTTWGR